MGKAKIDTPGSAHDAMAWRLEKAAALMGGTSAMRAAGRTFLPRYAQETPESYKVRLTRAVLYNYFKKTVRALGGKPFSRDLKVIGAPQPVLDCLDNVNLQGDSFHVVAQREFTNALAKGLAIFLIDFPTNTAANAAQEREMGLRPYLVPIAPENLLAAYVGINEKGEEVVLHARVYSEETIRVDYDEICVETIMVYEPTRWEKHQRKTGSRTFSLIEEGQNKLGYAPILCFYTEKESPFVSKPPLEDLADKNIEHWQSSSDQRHCLTVARFPMLAGSGITKQEGEVVKVGPYEMLFAESEHSKFYYVEHTGAALLAGKQDLDDIKAEMAIQALELTAPKDRQTATSAALDAGDQYSVLQMLAINYEDFLERVLIVMGDWLKVDAKASEVELHKEFGLSALDAKMLDALVAARNARDIDSATFLEELVRRGLLSSDLDVQAVITKAREEADAEAAKVDAREMKKLDLALRSKQAAGNNSSTPGGKTPPAGSQA